MNCRCDRHYLSLVYCNSSNPGHQRKLVCIHVGNPPTHSLHWGPRYLSTWEAISERPRPHADASAERADGKLHVMTFDHFTRANKHTVFFSVNLENSMQIDRSKAAETGVHKSCGEKIYFLDKEVPTHPSMPVMMPSADNSKPSHGHMKRFEALLLRLKLLFLDRFLQKRTKSNECLNN